MTHEELIEKRAEVRKQMSDLLAKRNRESVMASERKRRAIDLAFETYHQEAECIDSEYREAKLVLQREMDNLSHLVPDYGDEGLPIEE